MTPSELRRSILRVWMEIEGNTSEPLPQRRFEHYARRASSRYSPMIGMGINEWWHGLSDHELELLHDCVFERAAIVGDGGPLTPGR